MDDPGSASIVFRLLTVIVLVAANSFFVAAEFALVAVRKTRIDQLANEGVRLAKQARRAVESLDRYISGTQLGITIASLGLGWIGEPAVATVIERFFDALPERTALIATHGVAVAIAFSFITFLHIVLGELAPKALALQHPETVSRWVAVPLIGFTRAMNPFIWLLNGSANLTLKLIGAKPPSEAERVHQPDEILMIVKQSGAVGPLAKQDVEMIEGVFEFTEKIARDVMTPRTQVTALSASLTLDEAAAQVSSAMRSRYPVFEDDLDDIVGVIHAKEILANLKESRFETLRSIARDPLFVPGSREVENLLTDMKRLKVHMAIVLDEYGGTAGIVTMEDLLEEIVGLIYDEYDAPADEDADGGSTEIPGDTAAEEVNARWGFEIDPDSFQTIGGFVFGQLGRLPKVGDRVRTANGTLRVVEMDGRRVARLELVGGTETDPGTD